MPQRLQRFMQQAYLAAAGLVYCSRSTSYAGPFASPCAHMREMRRASFQHTSLQPDRSIDEPSWFSLARIGAHRKESATWWTREQACRSRGFAIRYSSGKQLMEKYGGPTH